MSRPKRAAGLDGGGDRQVGGQAGNRFRGGGKGGGEHEVRGRADAEDQHGCPCGSCRLDRLGLSRGCRRPNRLSVWLGVE